MAVPEQELWAARVRSNSGGALVACWRPRRVNATPRFTTPRVSPCGHRTGRTFASLRPVEPVIRGIVGDPDVGREPGVPERATRPPPPIWPPDSAEPPGRPQLGLTVPPRRAVLRWLRVFGGS